MVENLEKPNPMCAKRPYIPLLTSEQAFIYFYVLEESEVVARKSSTKKVFLNIPENPQENVCGGVSFAIKLQAGDLQLH